MLAHVIATIDPIVNVPAIDIVCPKKDHCFDLIHSNDTVLNNGVSFDSGNGGIFDFDGTLTDAEQEGAPFRQGYLDDICALSNWNFIFSRQYDFLCFF